MCCDVSAEEFLMTLIVGVYGRLPFPHCLSITRKRRRHKKTFPSLGTELWVGDRGDISLRRLGNGVSTRMWGIVELAFPSHHCLPHVLSFLPYHP